MRGHTSYDTCAPIDTANAHRGDAGGLVSFLGIIPENVMTQPRNICDFIFVRMFLTVGGSVIGGGILIVVEAEAEAEVEGVVVAAVFPACWASSEA